LSLGGAEKSDRYRRVNLEIEGLQKRVSSFSLPSSMFCAAVIVGTRLVS
jgi:hypothetical protein